MRNVVKLALAAFVAVMCVGALTVTSASAVDPLFITVTGGELLFTGTSGAVTLRAKQAGVEGTITCEKTLLFHGLALPLSSLARELHIEFRGKCEQTVGGSKGTCTEPIKLVLSYGQLGLLHRHVLLLVAPENGTLFTAVKCTNGNTKVRGAVIGEFPLNGTGGSSQYNVWLEDSSLVFKAKGITQEPEEIELSGTLMTGVGLTTEGFFGGKASAEATELLKFDGRAEIETQPPPRNITVRTIDSSVEAGRCPVNANGEVEFAAPRAWCEYEVNNTLTEEVEIVGLGINLPFAGACWEVRCLVSERPAGGVECKDETRLEPRIACYVRLEYVTRPRVAQTTNFWVAAERANGVPLHVVVPQRVV